MNHDELRAECLKDWPPSRRKDWENIANTTLALLDEVKRLQLTVSDLEQRCDPSGDLQARQLAEENACGFKVQVEDLETERDKLKEEVEQWKDEIEACGQSGVQLEAQLKTVRETSEPLIRRLNETDQAKQVDKHIGLVPDDWTTWVRVGDLRRLKEAHEDKD